MFGVYLVFSSCFKQNIVVIVSRCSQKPACYRNDVAASCFTADCESSGHMLISYLFLKQKRRFLNKTTEKSAPAVHLLYSGSRIWLFLVRKVNIEKCSLCSCNQKLYILPSVTPAAPFQRWHHQIRTVIIQQLFMLTLTLESQTNLDRCGIFNCGHVGDYQLPNMIKYIKQNIKLQPKPESAAQNPYSHLTSRGCAFTTWLISDVFGLIFKK